MKKLLIFLLILALMLPIVSCAKPETPPSEPQDSGSGSGDQALTPDNNNPTVGPDFSDFYDDRKYSE